MLLAAMATAAICLPSCSNEETPEKTEKPAELKIIASINPTIDITTRAAYNLQSTSIYNNDFTKLGMYIWKHGATTATTSAPAYNGYQNIHMDTGTPNTSPNYYTISKSGSTFLFPIDNTDVDVYLYAPYNSTAADNTMVSPAFTVADDQSTDANYVASDFIYGMATAVYTTDKTASVTMYHALSKIILKVVPASGVSVAGLSELKLTGVNRTTQIRMANAPSASMTVGTATTDHVATATAASGTDVIVTNTSNFVAADAETNGVAAIIPPQALTNLGISCTVDAKTATKTLAGLTYDTSNTVTEFLPGKVYTITLNIKTSGIEIRLISITDWVSGNGSGSSLDLDTWS